MSTHEGPNPPEGHAAAALHVPAGEGRTTWVAGDAYTIKALATQTSGSLSFFEAVVPPGGGPPLHSHRNEDEAFYLLSGDLDMTADGRSFTAHKGDFVFVPRGARHRFRNVGSADALMLFMYTPGGFERFFLEAGDDPVPGERPKPWPLDRVLAVGPLSAAAGMDVYPEDPETAS